MRKIPKVGDKVQIIGGVENGLIGIVEDVLLPCFGRRHYQVVVNFGKKPVEWRCYFGVQVPVKYVEWKETYRLSRIKIIEEKKVDV